ncbi:MAG: flavodoxin family protein [Candidatus Aenigmarchaeota archaeon]|nr:flavodoxin family protein [Candidatus Aenigmarchaeota archaeon]
MPEKILIVYESIHQGNTQKLAEKIGKALKAKAVSADKPGELAPIGDYALVGFGSGIYAGRHGKGLFKFVENLPKLKGKRAFIFSTSTWGESSIEKHHGALRKKLEEKGFRIVGEFACKGFNHWGPFKLIGGMNKGHPDEKDLAAAGEFAEGLATKLSKKRL